MNIKNINLRQILFYLIIFFKNICKKYLPFWFRCRIRVITSSIIDIIIFLLIFYLFKININLNFLAILGTWSLSSYIMGRYNFGKSKNIDKIKYKRESIKNLFFTIFISLLSILIIFLIDGNNSISSSIFIKLILILSSYGLISYLIQYLFIKTLYIYDIDNSNMVYLGNLKTFKDIELYIKENKLKLNLIKIDDIDELLSRKIKVQGLIIDGIKNFSPEQLKKIEVIHKKGLKVYSLLDWCENFLERIPVNHLNHDYVFGRNYFKLNNPKELKLKRIGDILFSIILLTATLPLIIISSFLIFIEDKGPIFYSQNRTGYFQEIIKIWKLRTMYVDSEKNGSQWSKRNDPRITKVGKFLRVLRIDELPQLISVLKGDMSLIGPRPERPEIDNSLIKKIPFYELRYTIRPGLSGWAQVNYPYGASIKDSEEKLSFDLYYLANFSFLLDFVILLKTIKLIFNGRGAIANQ